MGPNHRQSPGLRIHEGETEMFGQDDSPHTLPYFLPMLPIFFSLPSLLCCTFLARNSFSICAKLSICHSSPWFTSILTFPSICAMDLSYVVQETRYSLLIFPFLYIRWPMMNGSPSAIYSLMNACSTSQAPAQYWILHFKSLASDFFSMHFWSPRDNLHNTRSWLMVFLTFSAHLLCRSMMLTFVIAKWDRSRCCHRQRIWYDDIQRLVSSRTHLVLGL